MSVSMLDYVQPLYEAAMVFYSFFARFWVKSFDVNVCLICFIMFTVSMVSDLWSALSFSHQIISKVKDKAAA